MSDRLRRVRENSGRVPRVLSIAGSDPSGGAGIQADLKSIAANGGYGMAALAALTAQNTQGVRDVHVPGGAFLRAQLDAVSDDIQIDAVKIGMLADAENISVAADWLRRIRPAIVVLDPVMVATSGDRLLDAASEAAMRDLLVLADVVTPNLPELAVLTGRDTADDWSEALRQAQQLATGADTLVLVTGGHLDSPDAPDALVGAAGLIAAYSDPRIESANTHGTGCSLSAAVATRRAAGADWPRAIAAARGWLRESIAAGAALNVGAGHGPIDHFAGLRARAGLVAHPAVSALAADTSSGILAAE